jgi:replicative superfamily II helicase
VAPLKALCSEKLAEWKEKFEKLHDLKCIELTSDTDFDSEKDFKLIDNAHIICTTPVKLF